jgi:hypothetical protein
MNRVTFFKSMHQKSAKLFFILSLLVFLLLNLLQISHFANSAYAEKGYRYWGYFQAAPQTNEWVAAMTGPSTKLKDGAVEGWAFSFSTNDIPAAKPVISADFAAICKGVVQPANQIRVALVLDFGDKKIAPSNEAVPENLTKCVLTKTDSTGLDVLNQSVKVRTDKSGLICAFNDYPKTECSPEVDINLSPVAAEENETKEGERLETKQEVVSIIAAISGLVIATALALAIRRQKRSK